MKRVIVGTMLADVIYVLYMIEKEEKERARGGAGVEKKEERESLRVGCALGNEKVVKAF